MSKRAKVKVVTGFVPIQDHPRKVEEYVELGNRLKSALVTRPVQAFYYEMPDLWLTQFIEKLPPMEPPLKWATYDNPAKNTLEYHCVQHQKAEWLATAANMDQEADTFCWVDYGIFRLPGVTNQAIYEFMEKLDDKAIYAPGCWGKPDAVEAAYPCWRFCGSVIAVPRKLVDQFDYGVRVAARQHVSATKNVEWEVNTWARVEAKTKLPIHWYKADHDGSLFTGLDI